jgi:hypothetical protein
MDKFSERMLRAAKLDVSLYEEVEADLAATGQAAGVVVLASLAAGIGSIHTFGPASVVVGTLSNLIAWGTQALIIYYIGTTLLPEPQTDSSVGQLLRTIGFASAPGLIRILGVVPFLFLPVFAAAQVWTLVAFVVAVRQALDYKSTGRALIVCLVGLIVQIGIMSLVLAYFSGPAV